MRFSIRRAITVMALATLAGGIPALSQGGTLRALPAAASGQQTCSGPMFGGTITGPLLVVGDCELEDVTVNGSILISPNSSLFLLGNYPTLNSNSTVNGSITGTDGDLVVEGYHIIGSISMKGTQPLPLNAVRRTTAISTQQPLPFNAVGIVGSTIGGGTTVKNAAFGICYTYAGSVSLTNTYFEVGGNADESSFPLFPCGGSLNSAAVLTSPTVNCSSVHSAVPFPCGIVNILGSVTVTGSFGEFENNGIYGSAGISYSTIDFSSNYVQGSAQCNHDSALNDSDYFGNFVQGADTCENLPPFVP